MYGLEATVWTKNELERPEMVQNKTGRIAPGANRYVTVVAIRRDTEWITFMQVGVNHKEWMRVSG